MDPNANGETERRALADFLEDLAAQLRQGRVQAEGRVWEVPEMLHTEVHVKEKKGSIRYKLQWQWSTLEQYEKPAQESVEQWRGSLKTIKKRMGGLFKELRGASTRDELPRDRTVTELVEVMKAFSELAEPEWGEAVLEFLDHLSTLEAAVREGRKEAALHEIRDLGNRMAACHREFK